jgi:hypothetical protein
MANNINDYLLTNHFIEEFTHVVQEVEELDGWRENELLVAEHAGYLSVLEELRKESKLFERKNILIYHNEDDGSYCAWSNEYVMAQGVGNTVEYSLFKMRESLKIAIGVKENIRGIS